MYKVFYNDKVLLLTEKPLENVKSLKFSAPSTFDEAIAVLKNSNCSSLNIYYHNLDKLWDKMKIHFDYLEAAGGLVENQNQEYLFIYRLNRWDLPKGKVEMGETTEIAAVREVEEECGIRNLKLKHWIDTTYHIYFQGNLKLKATYWYFMQYNNNEKLIPQAEEGIQLAEWKSKAEIQAIFPDTYANIQIVLTEAGLA